MFNPPTLSYSLTPSLPQSHIDHPSTQLTSLDTTPHLLTSDPCNHGDKSSSDPCNHGDNPNNHGSHNESSVDHNELMFDLKLNSEDEEDEESLFDNVKHAHWEKLCNPSSCFMLEDLQRLN